MEPDPGARAGHGRPRGPALTPSTPPPRWRAVYTGDYYAKLAAVLAGGDFDVVTYNLSLRALLVSVVVPGGALYQGAEALSPADLTFGRARGPPTRAS